MSRIRFLVVFTVLALGLQLVDFVSAQTSIGPAPGPDITFTADPTNISNGDSSRLTWNSPTADACKEPDGWFFNDPKSGSKVVSPSSTTEYEVNCRNSKGTRTAYITVRVERCLSNSTCHGETIDIKINGSDGPVRFTSLPVTFTGEITLTSTDPWWAIFSPDPTDCVDWNFQSIMYLLGFGGTTYRTKTTLSATESNYGLHIYSVSCQFNLARDRISDSVDVIIEKPSPPPASTPTVNVSVNTNQITLGQSFILSWSSTNATSCTGYRGGSYSTGGSLSITPSSAGTYTTGMQCSGPGGISPMVTRNVNVSTTPPPAGLCPNGNGLYCGNSSLGQNTDYLYSCSSGNYSLSQSCTYSCQGSAPNSSCKSAPPVSGPAPSVDIKGQ